MSRFSRLLPTALHTVLLLGSGVALAQSAPPANASSSRQEAAKRDRGERADRGLPASVRRVERQTGGEVLRAEPMQRDGREVYRLKVLTADGRVRVVQDDPDRPREQRRSGPKGKDKGNNQDEASRDPDVEPPQ